jgi:transketolase
MVHKLSTTDDRVVFIGSDLSPGLLDEMKLEKPKHHYMEGIAEAHVIGMAAGMAMDGLIPYVNTISTFITRRCFEQVAVDLCLHNLPVKLIGNGGGLVYAPLGPTHLAIEDFAIMRALPNMTVVAVSDAQEMIRLMRVSIDWPYPMYIRLGKGGDPVVSQDTDNFQIGKAILRKEAETEYQVLLISTGVMTGRALDAASLLEDQAVGCKVLHMHTIKPYDEQGLTDAAHNARLIVTIEEHVINGGLGSATAEVISDANQSFSPLLRLALPDQFPSDYGRQENLLDLYKLNPLEIAKSISKRLATLND